MSSNYTISLAARQMERALVIGKLSPHSVPFAVYYFCILIKSNYRLEKYEKHECWAFFKNRRPFSPFCVDGFHEICYKASDITAPCILEMAEAWGTVCVSNGLKEISRLVNYMISTEPPITCIWVLLLLFCLFVCFEFMVLYPSWSPI